MSKVTEILKADRISNCAPAFDNLFSIIDNALSRGDKVTLEIVR